MAVFKCKMCGGEMSFEEGSTVAVCDYCGSRQTLPRLDNERKANLFDRANHFRRNNDFDKAMAIYEQILNEDINDAEAYWSLVLCQYGIQYVEDPSTHKRIPTVNRAQFTSIYADENYKAAIANADASQKAIYEEEAKKIEEIQKGILAISEKEEPFDVFICYKESDENGRRTHDSVLANELYHQLTQEGFKVFFSRITLEDKLGSAYEPYIFAALHSAKVMIVIGTKPEYFNAVWVKNEWSRYLSLIKQGEKKTLIPAYKDIDPYDLPEEFSHLQAQDMNKLGFMQDLIRGIRKLAGKEEPKNVSAQGNTNTSSGVNTQSLLKRAFLFLEDGQWDSADSYCDKVLDMDPENAQAYYGKLLAELHVTKPEVLRNAAQPFDGLNNYKKVIRFADDELRNTLQETVAFIKERNETERKTNIYNFGRSQMHNAKTKKDWETAAKEFQKIPGFQDADALVKKCEENAEIAQKNANYDWAVQQYEIAANTYISADDRKNACLAAIERMKTVSGWLDADKLLVKYNETLVELKKLVQEEKAEQERQKEEARLAAERERIEKEQQELLKIKRESRNAALRRIGIVVVSLLVVCGIGILIGYVVNVVIPEQKEKEEYENNVKTYEQVTSMLDNKDYSEAISLLKPVLDQDNSPEKSKNLNELYDRTSSLLDQKSYTEAMPLLQLILKYDENQEKLESFYSRADSLLNEKRYFEAYWIFKELGNYKDTAKKAQDARKEMTSKMSIAAGEYHTVALKKDGTVVAVGDNSAGQCNVSGWKDIVAVAAGPESTYGIKADGTVVATGELDSGSVSEVSKWTDIVAISSGYRTLGLKADGTAVASGSYELEWTDICAIASSDVTGLNGLKADGNTTKHDPKDDDQNLIAIAAKTGHTVGLKSDGTVIGSGSTEFGLHFYEDDMNSWRGITAVATGDGFVAGINSAGKVLLSNPYQSVNGVDTSQWDNVVQICAGWDHLVGLKADGTVVASGRNDDGQCNVSAWSGILVPTP